MGAEDHYLRIDQITSFHRQKIAELRKEAADVLATYPEYDTEFSLLRWLMGWDYDIKTILPKITYAIDTIRNLNLCDQETIDTRQINAHVRSLSQCADYFPGGLMGPDDEGNIVYMQCLSKTHPKSLVKCGCISELFNLSIAETEMAFKLVRRAEAKSGKKLGVKIIVDLDGFSMDLLYTPTLKIYLSLLTLLQSMFPDFARKIYVINCPTMIQAVYAMISPVLSKQTKEKVNFLGSDWKDVLVAEIGSHNLYPHWGGTKPSDNEYGDLRMGGKAPEKLWYDPENSPEESDKASLKKIVAAARSRAEVKIEGKEGQELRWWWRVSSGDVDFWIEKDGKQEYPKFRLSTEFHPEIGSIRLKSSGEYILYFDNSHGKVFGKDIKYKISLQ